MSDGLLAAPYSVCMYIRLLIDDGIPGKGTHGFRKKDKQRNKKKTKKTGT